MKLEEQISNPLSVKKGARQGYILSPALFNIYDEHIVRKILVNWRGRVSVGVVRINNLCYADDIMLLANTAEELTEFVT